MLPKFVEDPDSPTLNLLFVMFTLDIIYIHHSLSFTIRTAKTAAKAKKVSTDTTNTGFPHRDLIRPILRRSVTRMLNWSHETGCKLH